MYIFLRIICCAFLFFFLHLAHAESRLVAGTSEPSMEEFHRNYVPEEYHPFPENWFFVDLGIITLLIGIGLYLVIRQNSAQSISILMIITLVYLAFVRGGCICPVGTTANITLGLISPREIGLFTLFVFLVPLIAALFMGKVFCSSACPIGAVQHLAPERKKKIRIPEKLNKLLKAAPVIILLLTIWLAASKRDFFICDIDPYKGVFYTGQSWSEQLMGLFSGRSFEGKFIVAAGLGTWIYFLIIMVAGYFFARPFCRFICPYGVLLGVVGVFSLKSRNIDDQSCKFCGLCEKSCPTQAIKIDRKLKEISLSAYDCVQCNRCSDKCRQKAIHF